MGHRVQPHEHGKKKASIPATVLFVALAMLLVYGAARWMGGALTRFLEVPDGEVQKGSAAASVSPTPEHPRETAMPESTPRATPMQQNLAEQQVTVPESTAELIVSEEENKQAMSNATVWSGTRYAAAFSEERMDMVIALSDENGKLSDICMLALRDGRVDLLAVPTSCMVEDGRMLSEFSAANTAAAMRLLLPVDFDRYLVLPRGLLADSIDALGPLQVSGRKLDGTAATEYLETAADAPLLRAERFSHLLCALPESMSAMSLLRMLRLKTALEEEVKTNIKEAEGWQFINIVRKLSTSQITEITLPVETVRMSGERAYRLDAALTEQILQKLYKTSEKTS